MHNYSFVQYVDRNIFPDNLIQACFQQMQTTYVARKNSGNLTSQAPMVRKFVHQNGLNVLGVYSRLWSRLR